MGFVLGPDGAERSWNKALDQTARRADLRAQLGPGLHDTSMACNVCGASLLRFLLQVEVLPAAWESVEDVALRRMVPGPANLI